TWRGASIYDDYGHHPTKVRATLAAARELEPRRLVLVFQPHRFTRFQALRDEFAESLRGADRVVVTEIYPAGEENPGRGSGRRPGRVLRRDGEPFDPRRRVPPAGRPLPAPGGWHQPPGRRRRGRGPRDQVHQPGLEGRGVAGSCRGGAQDDASRADLRRPGPG